MNRPPKITQFRYSLHYNKTYINEHNILRLDIPVNDMFQVHVLDAFEDLAGQQGRALLRKSELFSHQVVQLAIDAQLLDEVYVLFV